jgi:hypothetical protein
LFFGRDKILNFPLCKPNSTFKENPVTTPEEQKKHAEYRAKEDLRQITDLRRSIDANNGLIHFYSKEIDEVLQKGAQEYPTQIQSCRNTIESCKRENARKEAELEKILNRLEK